MKTFKLVIGIICCVLSLFVMFQSCAVGVLNTIEDNSDSSGSAGFFVALLMLSGGIVSIAARNRRGGAIANIIIFGLAFIIGISNTGTFSDLVVWAVLCAVIAAINLISIFTQKFQNKNE